MSCRGSCVSFGEKFVVHIREDIEQHSIFEFLVSFHESLDTEDEKLVITDVGMTIEKLALSPNTHL